MAFFWHMLASYQTVLCFFPFFFPCLAEGTDQASSVTLSALLEAAWVHKGSRCRGVSWDKWTLPELQVWLLLLQLYACCLFVSSLSFRCSPSWCPIFVCVPVLGFSCMLCFPSSFCRSPRWCCFW